MEASQQGEGGAADSQQTPDQNSELQTPQPDQAVPSGDGNDGTQDPQGPQQAETTPDAAQAAAPVDNQSAPEPYQPSHPPLENAGLDQQAAEAERQAELDAQRQEHNERTGGGETDTDGVHQTQDTDQA